MKTQDPLESQEFYDLCQNYRICSVASQDRVIEHFENLKSYIRENFTLKDAPSQVEKGKYTVEQIEGMKIAEAAILEVARRLKVDLGEDDAAMAVEISSKAIKNLYYEQNLEKAVKEK